MSSLELRFWQKWKTMGGPPLERELKLIPGRRFRFDFTHPESRVTIELQGSVFQGGRHTRGEGYMSDREKRDLVEDLGFKVYELTGKCVTNAMLSKIMAKIAHRLRVRPWELEQAAIAALPLGSALTPSE
jgi:very-short-patch-repair endonuclease